MSTNKTQNYNLHAWALEDDFLTSEINENFAALDAALKAGLDAQASALNTAKSQQSTALTQQVNTLNTAINKKTELVVGSYVGNDAASRKISLGFTPKAVLVIEEAGRLYTAYGDCFGGLAVTGNPAQLKSVNYEPIVVIVDGGFTVYYSTMPNILSNHADHAFRYLALK